MLSQDNAAKESLAPGDASLRLSEFDGSRHNNFTTIRIFLAWSVLYGHSYAVAKTAGVDDPLNQLFQGSLWIGELAVNGFFALSGFLVTASFIKRGVLDYTISRALRIFPALAACVLLSALVVGPLFTSLTLAEYFSSNETWVYLRNALAFYKMYWTLPGVFENNPRDAINGSLWTLTVEVRCYLFLAMCGMFGVLRDRTVATVFVLALLAFAYFHFDALPLFSGNINWSRPAFYFLTGVFTYINRDKVVLDFRIAILATLLCYSAFGQPWFDFVFPFAFVYLLFYLAYATPYLNADGKLGDLSYGMYIYAWPAQQAMVALLPGMHPYLNTLLSSLVVISLAYASWHYLEKPMLGMKKRLLRK